MKGVLLVSHGESAKGMVNSARYIMGDQIRQLTHCCYTPKTDLNTFREKLNVVDNPGNKGKEVLLYGTITNYFSTAGVKELEEAVIDGQTITGIQTITVDDVNAPAYSLDGRRVDASFRGVVIKNGKKLIQK